MASSEQNKAVVRRFITEGLQATNLAVLDELLAPDYVNPAMGGADREAFKGIVTAMGASVSLEFTIRELVADGDSVVARFSLEVTRSNGEKLPAEGLTYYRLANGKVVEDDPYTRPDLAQLLGMAPPH
ncbi:MAG: nuclear transport factor 2 family protein [Chloroflexi bacterium]|nr:nuclear transport factor 2 family protein [Chloroflexota bacterium]